MQTQEPTSTDVTDLRGRLILLEMERATASLSGLDGNGAFMSDLLEELEHVRAAYVRSAVTEIASLRAALDAPLAG
jgi:hypothetical protein